MKADPQAVHRSVFEGDNLHVLRGLDSESVDLIYLDPPFNSNRTYSAPIGSKAAGAAGVRPFRGRVKRHDRAQDPGRPGQRHARPSGSY